MKKNLQYFIWTTALVLIFMGSGKAQGTPDPNLKAPDLQPVVIDKTSSRLSTDLNQLYSNSNPAAGRQSAAKPVLLTNGLEKQLQVKGDMVLVDITVKGSSKTTLAELEKTGFKASAVFGRVISGRIPINALPQLESVSSIQYVQPAYKPRHQGKSLSPLQSTKRQLADVTPIISQGDTALRAHLARGYFNVNGKGVKIGTLSDSYNNLGGAEIGIQRGELPGVNNPLGFTTPVQVLKDLSDSSGIDEGRGMMEIIHDVAPGAELAFYTAFEGQADFAKGILNLADSGCKVINDDIYYFAEPFFQDGIIAQAVDIVKNKGVTYFSAAGNAARQSYESDYRASTATPLGAVNGTAHNFSAPGDPPRYAQPIFIPTGGQAIISFQWDQPFFSAGGNSGATTDLDIYLANAQGVVVAGSVIDNLSSGDPVEVFGYFNATASTTFFVYIINYFGPSPSKVKYINFGDGFLYQSIPAIPGINAPTIVGHAKAEGAIATAAAPFLWTPGYGLETPRVEGFSSAGGVPNYFDKTGNRIAPLIRRKPEFTSVDGGNTSFFYADSNIDTDTFPNFFGTSAAAPHAAAVASLMIEAQKSGTITPGQIKGILADRTDDMDDPDTPGFDVGFDFKTGTGLIQADETVDFVRFPNVFVKALDLQPACSDNPANTRNWKVINPNPFEVKARYLLTGLPFQFGDITVPPGEYVFSTKTLYIGNRQAPNILILEWEDNLGVTSYDIASGTTSTCSIVLSENNVNGTTASDINAKVNIAEVYPNPSAGNFRLYLSLAEQQSTGIELYSIEGKLLYKNMVRSNGLINIDASGYKPGVYILKVRQGQFNKTIKLFKK